MTAIKFKDRKFFCTWKILKPMYLTAHLFLLNCAMFVMQFFFQWLDPYCPKYIVSRIWNHCNLVVIISTISIHVRTRIVQLVPSIWPFRVPFPHNQEWILRWGTNSSRPRKSDSVFIPPVVPMEDKLSDFGDVKCRRKARSAGDVESTVESMVWRSSLAHPGSRPIGSAGRMQHLSLGELEELVDNQGILREGIQLKDHLSHLGIYWLVSWLYVKLGWLIYLVHIGGLVKVIVSGCFFLYRLSSLWWKDSARWLP